VGRIRSLVVEWRDGFAEQVLAAIDEGRGADVLALFVSGEGRRRIDAIQEISDGVAGDLHRRLDGRRTAADRAGVAAAAVAAAVTVVAVAAVVRVRRRLDARIVTPIRSLADAASELARGNLGIRAAARGTTEIDALTTAFNAMAAETERTVEELRQLDRMKSEFVSIVSHELRTPLTSLRGSLGLLDAGAVGALPESAASMLRIALSNTERLVRLVNDILDLERIESGAEVLDLRPHPVDGLVEEAVANVAGAADGARVQIDRAPVGGSVVADRDRAVQALTNLLANAVKFSEPGATVRVAGSAVDGLVRLDVVDQGRGIPPDKLETIFGRFQQVDSSDGRDRGGTGLGLAIVKSIADRHGGSVAVASELDRGSTFSLSLPAAPDD